MFPWLAALMLVSGPSGAQKAPARKKVVAVLELQGSDIPQRSLQLWTDLLRAAVIQSVGSRFEVMTAGNQEYLLKANGIDPAQVCDGATCDVDLLKNLDADFGFSGSVARLASGSYVGTLELYDTARGSALGAVEVRAGSEEEWLDAIRQKGASLSRQIPGVALNSSEASLEEDLVPVSLQSEPRGAMVLEGGEPLCQSTPCEVRLSRGVHELRYALAEHRSEVQVIEVRRGKPVPAVRLAPTYAVLRVAVTPPGARLSLDGKARASAELAAGVRVPAGAHEVWVEDPCHPRRGERVVLAEGETRAVSLVAPPWVAALDVDATDAAGDAWEVDVYADGVFVGTSAQAVAVPVCVKRIEAILGRTRVPVEVPPLTAGGRAFARARIGAP